MRANNEEDCVDIPDIEFSLRFVEVDVAETHLNMGNPIYYFEESAENAIATAATKRSPRLIKEFPCGKKEVVEIDSSGSIRSLMAI